MPDQKDESDPSIGTDQKESSTIFDSDIGDDWGEAFEAEEFMLTPDQDEGSSDFFLEDDAFAESDSEGTVDGSTADSLADTKSKAAPLAEGAAFFARLLHQARQRLEPLWAKILALPLHFRIPALALPVLLFAALLLLLKPGPPSPEQITEAEEAAGTTQTIEEGEITSEQVDTAAEEEEIPEVIREKVRKKWSLPDFLISTSDQANGEDIFFVAVDLTLILVMDEETPLPEEQTTKIRDIVFEFYNNRPLYELRRYSLARGEMKRKLKTWIDKQWPEGPLVTITFDRYQVL